MNRAGGQLHPLQGPEPPPRPHELAQLVEHRGRGGLRGGEEDQLGVPEAREPDRVDERRRLLVAQHGLQSPAVAADRLALPRLVLVDLVGEALGGVHAGHATTGHRQFWAESGGAGPNLPPRVARAAPGPRLRRRRHAVGEQRAVRARGARLPRMARPPHARPRRLARGARRRRAGHHRRARLRQRELPAQPARLLRAALAAPGDRRRARRDHRPRDGARRPRGGADARRRGRPRPARHPARPAAAHQGPDRRAATQDRRLGAGAPLPQHAHRGREGARDLPRARRGAAPHPPTRRG